jgi:SnoaL-like polyketide cyclase
MAPGFISHPLFQKPDREGYKRQVAGYVAAFSNVSIVIEEQLAAGDKVASRITGRATHARTELLGAAPTGREVSYMAILIHRICGGKIAEEWGVGTAPSELMGERLEQEVRERARRAGARGGPKHPAGLAARGGAPTRGLADLPLLPACQGGRRGLLRLPPTPRGQAGSPRGGRHRQGCACSPGDVHHLRHAAVRRSSLGVHFARGGTSLGQRDVVGPHTLQHVRHVFLRCPRPRERQLEVRQREPRPALRAS